MSWFDKRMRGMAAALVLAALVPAASAVPLATAHAADGVLQAFTYLDIPPGATWTVDAVDDSEDMVRIRSMTEQALDARGMARSGDGQLLLDIDAGHIAQGTRRGAPFLGTFNANTGVDPQGTGATVVVNVWSNRQHSILGGERAGPDYSVTNDYYVSFSIRDRATGMLLWQGEAQGSIRGDDPIPMAGAMVDRLTDSIGQTVRSEPIRLP